MFAVRADAQSVAPTAGRADGWAGLIDRATTMALETRDRIIRRGKPPGLRDLTKRTERGRRRDLIEGSTEVCPILG